LERQLSESETAKSQAEMTLTERLARPLTQTEAQVGDMRRALEDLRQQCKHRVSVLISEVISLQDKVANLETALFQVEAVASARMEEVVSITEAVLLQKSGEMEKMQQKLNSNQADMEGIEQLKTLTEEYQKHDEVCKNEVRKLQRQVEQLNNTQKLLQENLAKATARERQAEKLLLEKMVRLDHGSAEVKAEVDMTIHTTGMLVDAEGEEVEEGEVTAVAIAEDLVQQSRERLEDVQSELADSRSYINELILEIEAVSSDEIRTREQNSRLLQQLSDASVAQRGGIEENLRLLNQIEVTKTLKVEAEAK